MGEVGLLPHGLNKQKAEAQLSRVEKLLSDALEGINLLPAPLATAYRVTATAIELQLNRWKAK